MPSYDFVRDLLENMESQGFQYYLVLLDKDSKKVNDKIIVYTTFEKDEVNEIIKSIKIPNKVTEKRPKKKGDENNGK